MSYRGYKLKQYIPALSFQTPRLCGKKLHNYVSMAVKY